MASILQTYEEWVRSEAAWYLPALDTLKSVTLFMPGRFNENMVKVEAIYSGMNVVGLYHDTICGRPRSPTFDLKCGKETTAVRKAKNVLGVLELTEVLIEMTASSRFGGNKSSKKWLVVMAVEMIKSFCRLLLLRNHGGRMVSAPSPDEIVSIKEATELGEARADLELALSKTGGDHDDVSKMYIEHDRCAKNPHGTFLANALAVTEPPAYEPSPAHVASEVLYILRPVSYVAGRALYSKDERSWRPLVLSLFCDISSRLLSPSFAQLTSSQRAEMSRRSMLYLLYLCRSPLFERWTRGVVMRFGALIGKLPLLGSFISGIIDLLLSLQVHYFYTSAS